MSVRIDDRVSSAISLYPIGNAFTGTGLIVKNGVLTKGVDPATGSSIKTWEFGVVRQKDRKSYTRISYRRSCTRSRSCVRRRVSVGRTRSRRGERLACNIYVFSINNFNEERAISFTLPTSHGV